jgi:hypothetical protein
MTEHLNGKFYAAQHKYVFTSPEPGIDGEVVAEQSRKATRLDKELTIVVHYHRFKDHCDPEKQRHDAYGTSVHASLRKAEAVSTTQG